MALNKKQRVTKKVLKNPRISILIVGFVVVFVFIASRLACIEVHIDIVKFACYQALLPTSYANNDITDFMGLVIKISFALNIPPLL